MTIAAVVLSSKQASTTHDEPPRAHRASSHARKKPTLSRLAGSVSHSGAPVAGARVCALGRSANALQGATRCVESDADGRYALSLAVEETYYLSAQARGFEQTSANRAEPITLSEAGPTEVDIVLSKAGVRLAGVVLDATGGPVAGATVRATRNEGGLVVCDVESAEDGSFEVWTAPGQVTLYGQAEGYAPALLFPIAPRDNVQIVLTPGGALSGRVISALDGEPVTDVQVRAEPVDFRQLPGPPVQADEEGEFRISGLPPGGYQLIAEGSHARGASRNPAYVELGETLEGLVVEAMSAVSVSGQVVVAGDSAPCEGGLVGIGPPSEPGAEASAPRVPALSAFLQDGEFRIEGVTPGVYTVSVDCAGHVEPQGPTHIEVKTSPLEGLRWVAKAGLGLLVSVVDEGGRPVPHARFGLLHP